MRNPETTGNTPPPPPPVELPEAIIQHIQSCLNGTEAAQTTLLSKSWYTAWITRPNLDFDHKYFARKSDFWNFVYKTVERYDKLNLQIHSLRLRLGGSVNIYSNVEKLIMKALNVGATCLDLNVFFCDTDTLSTLPHQVFESENLNTLPVSWCKIDGKVSCSRLKSLTLEGDIISRCPLFKNLSLGSGPFNKLKSLLLSRVKVHDSRFFNDFSCKFPCLKDLSIHRCRFYRVIQISSPSLECINIKVDDILRVRFYDILSVKFDVPCIRKFTFSGTSSSFTSSSLTLITTSHNWESSIYIRHCFPHIRASWFLQLNEFLKKLSQSKVSLTLEFLLKASLYHDASLEGLTKPEVENLSISGRLSACPDTFYALFQLCRPIYITQYWLPESWNINKKKRFIGNINKRKRSTGLTEFGYKKMMMREAGLKSCTAYQRTSGGECDLEEVSVEFYDESVSAWCPTSPEADEQRLRLHLTWIRH